MRPRNPERVRAWRDRIDEWKRSGQSIHAFCRDHHLTRSNFDRWRRILAAESGSAPTTSTLAFVRTLYAVEAELKAERERVGPGFTSDDAVRWRQTRTGPILAQFADWLEVHHRSAPPKSLFGQAVNYARNQWPSLTRYLGDARFGIDNGAAERAIRPLAVGRANWLHIGGDGGLKTTAVLLSVCASATRHGLNPWSYLRDVFDRLAERPADADMSDLLPDVWAEAHLAG